jgi:hypothetical protein
MKEHDQHHPQDPEEPNEEGQRKEAIEALEAEFEEQFAEYKELQTVLRKGRVSIEEARVIAVREGIGEDQIDRFLGVLNSPEQVLIRGVRRLRAERAHEQESG